MSLRACKAPLAIAGADANAGYAVDANTLVFGVVPDSADTETNCSPRRPASA